jgi:hypothetical protein
MNPTSADAYAWPTHTSRHAADARTLLLELAREGMPGDGIGAALRLALPHATDTQRGELWKTVTYATYAIQHAGEYVETPEILATAEQEINDAFRNAGLL